MPLRKTVGEDFLFRPCALEGRGNAAEVERLQVRLDNAYKQSELKTQELIKANADHYISAYIIALNMLIDDEATLRAKYELLGPSARAFLSPVRLLRQC